MAVTTTSTQLGCGRDIDQVWDHINRPPDPHEQTCPYCQAARADLTGLAQATRTLRDAEGRDPEREPGPQVLERILTVARAEVRRGRQLPLDQPGPHQTSPNTVSEQAVTAVVRRVGDRTDEVQIRRCTIDVPSPGPDAVVDDVAAPGPARVAVSLRVSVARDLPIGPVCQQLRTAVLDAVRSDVGLDVTSVDIAVEDLHDA